MHIRDIVVDIKRKILVKYSRGVGSYFERRCTTTRKFEARTWKSLGFNVLNVAAVNHMSKKRLLSHECKISPALCTQSLKESNAKENIK